jgi:hypothetical protein
MGISRLFRTCSTGSGLICDSVGGLWPITVAARSKLWPSSPAETLGSWARIPLEAWMSVRLFCVCVVLCVVSGLARGWCLVQGVLPTVYKVKRLKKHLYCCRCVFNSPLHNNYRGEDYIEHTVLILLHACMLRALPTNDRCLQSHCLVTGVYATIIAQSFTWNISCMFRLLVTLRPISIFLSKEQLNTGDLKCIQAVIVGLSSCFEVKR